MVARASDTSDTTYGIGTVSRLTGISVHTIRVWERRYGAVVADRTPKGTRRYRPDDVERLTLLKRLVDQGRPISTVAPLTDDELRDAGRDYAERAAAVHEIVQSDTIRVAAVGEFLPSRLAGHSERYEGVEILIKETDMPRFKAGISRLRPDVLVLELSTLSAETEDLVRELKRLSRARRVVIVFGFGRQALVERLEDDGTQVLRAPVTTRELYRVISRPIPPAPVLKSGGPADLDEEIPALKEAPPRRYSREQLARLAARSSTVECECPTHIVELVVSLTAFEVYSAECENTSPQDAALHAYLHSTSAQARAMMEEALARVAAAEGIDPDAPAET